MPFDCIFHFWSPPICVSLALCKLQIFSNFKKWLCVLSMHDGYYVNTCVWACHTNYFFFFIWFLFCHLFKMFLFSFLFNFVWNISSQHLGLFLPLIILLSFSIPFFLSRFFSSFTWCILCHIFLLDVYYAHTWVPHAIHFLSATLYFHDIHTVTFYLLYEVICIHCKFILFSLQISTSFYLLFIVSFFTWYLSCQHLGPTCHLLSLRHFILPWHSHRHFIFTLWSHLYKHHIHCKITSFTLFIYIFIFTL